MNEVKEKLNADKDLKIIDIKTAPLEEQEHPNVPNIKLYATFSEIELEANDLKKIIALAFDYMPSNIEILEPAGMEIDLTEIADLMNDLMARLHQYESLLKNLHAENKLLKQKLNH